MIIVVTFYVLRIIDRLFLLRFLLLIDAFPCLQDVIEEMCSVISVRNPHEMDEFSLYCIVDGDAFTMPLARDEYVLDVTTELHKNHQVFYLIFCRYETLSS